MFKTMTTSNVVVLLSVLVIVGSAEPLTRRTTFARQVAAPAPTGYPAAGVTPEVPFDLPSSTPQPDSVYGPPDNTYGPPDNTYGPPDNTYGPPANSADEAPAADEQPAIETDDLPPADEEEATKLLPEDEEPEVLVAVEDDGTIIAVSNTVDESQQPSARFYQRFPQGGRRQQSDRPLPERLILARQLRYRLRQ